VPAAGAPHAVGDDSKRDADGVLAGLIDRGAVVQVRQALLLPGPAGAWPACREAPARAAVPWPVRACEPGRTGSREACCGDRP